MLPEEPEPERAADDGAATWTRTPTGRGPDVDPELLVTGSDWMDVGALVASGPEVEVL